jgi:hypothetical protein
MNNNNDISNTTTTTTTTTTATAAALTSSTNTGDASSSEGQPQLMNTLHVEDYGAVKGSSAVAHSEQAAVKELNFAFKRAASRLAEMGGRLYQEEHARQWPEAIPLP